MTAAYGSVVMEHFRRPRNRRALTTPTASHESYNALCGDRVRVDVEVRDGVLTDVAFTANACAVCTASASLLTERARGMSVSDADAIADASLLSALDTVLPPSREACALLPMQALRGALGQRQTP